MRQKKYGAPGFCTTNRPKAENTKMQSLRTGDGWFSYDPAVKLARM